ncbi:MAG: MATE family efflux transporter [Motiliproteus sp.]|nr:MATE family efflux transporter [Motiliproteus sp.]MCW9053123.1 MATE family efflux transporter [Motiliproteus sp.]
MRLLRLPLQRIKAILVLGLPIIGGMLSQSLLNLIDTAMVGSLGENSLAGVGVGGYANFMAIALIMGLSSGVQSMVARRQGQQRFSEIAVPVNGGLFLAVIFAIPLTFIFLFFSNPLIALITDTTEVLDTAIPYFEYRLMAIPAVAISLCFRGYWNGTNRGWAYLRVLILMHILNVAISYCLIFGKAGLPEMGAAGAGLGTTIALYLGAVTYAIMTYRAANNQGLLRNIPEVSTLLGLLKLSIPSSLQQFMFATSLTVLFWIIAQIGVQELAVAQVLIHLSLLLILPAVGLGMAATTFVSHALGCKKIDHAEEIGWDVVKLTTLILLTLSLPMWIFPDQILGLFLHRQELIELARLPLMITGVAICIDTAAIVFTQALLGAGANKKVMKVTTCGQWLLYLPLAWFVGPYLGAGILGIWLVQVLHRGLSSVVFAYLWWKKDWTHIKV